MKTAAMHSWLLPCLLGGIALASPAFAQDDDTPYAYPDEEKSEEVESPRRRSKPEDLADDFRQVSEEEDEEKKLKWLANLDDPNTGVAFELLGGAMLLSSPRGQFADIRPAVGGRFTWEIGRLFNNETLREALWFDVRYTYAGMREGTQLIVGDTRLHYATIAPAYELTVDENKNYGFYAQAGGGIAYQHTALEIGGKATQVAGIKSLIQYGVGFRGRTPLSTESNLRLAWRIELMRFRRGYMDDTFVGASMGTAF
jgi:hypothetical protein